MAFPNVPNVPGVPALLRAPGVVNNVIELLFGDALTLFSDNSTRWGLFLNGEPVVTAESVVSFEFKQGYRVATFPIEPAADSPGAFESYNKVQKPFDVRLRFSTGDTAEARQELFDSAEAACASLDLLDAVMPEKTFSNVNPTSWDFRRTAANGVTLVVVDIFCEQIRTTASSSFTSGKAGEGIDTSTSTTSISVRPVATIVDPKSPSASRQVNGGTVQPSTDPSGQFNWPT
jgi:hypothetical protein